MKGGLLKSPSSAGRPKPGQSNIRGKISGPIPIQNPAEDDEFPMRERGTGHATPLGSEAPNRLAPPQERGSIIDNQSTNGQVRVSPEERTPSRNQPGTSQASENSGSPAQQRTTRSSTLRYSTVSNNTDSDRDTPQRKKSTLRSALSKLFGRKKKNSSNGGSLETHHENPSEPALQRSEPSSLSRGARTKEGEPKRSASLPITEFDRALRSHSVGPEDIIAIESARNSLQVEPMKYRKRAATTTSRLFNTKSRDFGDLQGLSPRPASAQGRANQEITDDDPSNIGRAITSDILTLHRRSRSLSQLPDDGSHLQRRRSDEIRYWRESYNAGLLSPTSSNANEDMGVLPVEPPESPAKPVPMTPPQPFNFGPVAGMKITQAVTIEERITALETSNQKLEKLVYQLFQLLPGVNEYPATSERPPPAAPRPYSSAHSTSSVSATRARENASRDSNDSFGDENTFIGSIPPSSGLANRPVSTATVRGATSLPTLHRNLSGQFTPDHYTTLLAIIETERSARQALEAQVHKMSTQLQLLSRASQKGAPANGPTYSTFEHDDDEEETHLTPADDDLSGSEAFKTPNEEYHQHGFGAFGEELTDEESDGRRKRAARTLSLSQLTLKKPPRASKASKASKKHPEAGVNL
ncbi:hypothetical protein PG999_006515 [Apiospora kogelbergensis]|uniref:Uncharacterized protein n=1 Tax=Apiospora kogelbergensis TaxID=1337665 RepID=A0AAW0QS59_9PEZI